MLFGDFFSDIEIAEQFLLTVEEGLAYGKSWIVDLYHPTGRFMKYSGTMDAGSNSDIFGRTCDTFAHFCVCESDYELALVDIQGTFDWPFLSFKKYLAYNLNKV